MKRIGLVLGLTLSAALSLCTLSVLIRPVFAQSCSAKCPGGGGVTCYGHSCTAKDGDAPASAAANRSTAIQRVFAALTAHSAGCMAGLPDLAGFGAPIRNRRSDNDKPPPRNMTTAPSQISSTSGL